ncbi:aldose epimerase family protein [Schaedlerella sp.]|uniref:aldose epimerase family protein n=1 Tax=Schaedlerella sp. TaxID=2676057 RepID=UPI003746DE6D
MKPIKISAFGTVKDGKEAKLYTLTNDAGMSAEFTDYGASLVRLFVPDREGRLRDVVLGYENAAGYEAGTESIGAPVGRNANRIGGASFELNGVTVSLTANQYSNNLHSGPDVYNKRFWEAEEIADDHLTFLLHSPDGDQGFPGALDMKITCTLTEENELRFTYDAVPDADTVINMTNHSYFNLNGHDSGNILSHEVTLDADAFTLTDADSIPTGEFMDVAGTPMDFRNGRVIGDEIDSDFEAIRLGRGYDHNWVLKNGGKFGKVAEAAAHESGIVMDVYTDLPGIQVYTSNFLDQETGKDGAVYPYRAAVCFETQYFPDAVHHENFPSSVCRAGHAYHTVTAYRFRREG